LAGYLGLYASFEQSQLNPIERQLVALTTSRSHDCRYCMAAHSALAQAAHMPADVLAAIRGDQPIADPKLQALREFTAVLVERRGWLADTDLQALFAVGYDQTTVLEVILGVACKMLSNYTNHLVDTQLDSAFAQQVWDG